MDGWIGQSQLVMSSPATLEAIMAGPSGSPYEGSTMTLEVIASDGYPFTPPAVRLKERVSACSIHFGSNLRRQRYAAGAQFNAEKIKEGQKRISYR